MATVITDRRQLAIKLNSPRPGEADLFNLIRESICKLQYLILFFSILIPAHAADFAIGTINSTYHFAQNKQWNENHRGVYIRYKRLSVGRFVNSIDRVSTIYLYESKPLVKHQINYSFIAGVATNYKGLLGNPFGVLPIIGVKARYKVIWLSATPIGLTSGLEWNF